MLQLEFFNLLRGKKWYLLGIPDPYKPVQVLIALSQLKASLVYVLPKWTLKASLIRGILWAERAECSSPHAPQVRFTGSSQSWVTSLAISLLSALSPAEKEMDIRWNLPSCIKQSDLLGVSLQLINVHASQTRKTHLFFSFKAQLLHQPHLT